MEEKDRYGSKKPTNIMWMRLLSHSSCHTCSNVLPPSSSSRTVPGRILRESLSTHCSGTAFRFFFGPYARLIRYESKMFRISLGAVFTIKKNIPDLLPQWKFWRRKCEQCGLRSISRWYKISSLRYRIAFLIARINVVDTSHIISMNSIFARLF